MQLGEGLKKQRLLFGWNTDSGILHAKLQAKLLCIRAKFRFYANRDLSFLGKLDCIAYQINEYLTQTVRVAHNQLRYIFRYAAGQPDIFFLGFG
ncbi:hypothetical protein D3C73_1255300 [compost metagenome]